jgi:hypothetical protein
MRISLIQNMGKLDRTIRVCLGIALAVFGTLIIKGTIGIILVILAIPLVFFAIIGFCPLYVPFGVSTKSQGACL